MFTLNNYEDNNEFLNRDSFREDEDENYLDHLIDKEDIEFFMDLQDSNFNWYD